MMINITLEQSYPTPVANSPLLPLLLLSLATQKHTPETKSRFSDEYDYIIVGAGSAGSVVASRLSEMSCVTVLLLEAGKSSPVLDDVPGFAGNFWNTDLDWKYNTTPQVHTGLGLLNQQVSWPSGKSIGGSSIINSMLYIRGNRKNYDDWEAQGAKGWSFKDVLPYFLKMEDNKNSSVVANGNRGVGGLLTVENQKYDSKFKSSIFEAASELEYPFTDPNGDQQTGFSDPQLTIRNQQRCSVAKAYLVPAENRTNLDILSEALVTKINIVNDKAEGVSFEFNGQSHKVKARREVIVSAGTVNTAQLLMLSGIGPKEELLKHNIPLVADLPVGENLQDHCSATMAYEMDPHIPRYDQELTDPESTRNYINNRSGILTSTVVAVAFLNNEPENCEVDFPDYELYICNGVAEVGKVLLGLSPEAYKQVYEPYEGKPIYFCIAQPVQPRSRGNVRLQSSNPHDPPLINPNYMAEPEDINDMVRAMKECDRIANTRAMKNIGSKAFNTSYPGCEKYVQGEDDYYRCHIKSELQTKSHQVGTAKMGDPKVPSTVVDPQLKVKGIDGLRVVDASVIPIVTSGNTNVPVIMVAEKASDIIKTTINCN